MKKAFLGWLSMFYQICDISYWISWSPRRLTADYIFRIVKFDEVIFFFICMLKLFEEIVHTAKENIIFTEWNLPERPRYIA